MRYYLPRIGRFISRVRLDQVVAMGLTTYEELQDEWRISANPFQTPEGLARNGVPEHPYVCCANDLVNCVDPAGLWGPAVHRDKTLEWAKTLGFCDNPSKAIADVNLYVDKDKKRFPTRRYHMVSRLLRRDVPRKYSSASLSGCRGRVRFS